MSRQINARLALVALAAATLLSACSPEVKRTIGLERTPPDEFAVVSRAPLSMPPDYRLRPPRPGAERPQEAAPRDQARNALMGGATRQIEAEGRSSGEVSLLRKAGADMAEPDIRAAVNRETQALAEADESFVDRIMFWREPQAPGTVVDAEKEAKRLRENQALGRGATEGETPVIQRRKRGLLEGLL